MIETPSVLLVFIAAGSLSDWGPAQQAAVQGEVAALAGVNANDVELTVTAGSVVVRAKISVVDASAATATVSSLGTQLADAAAASNLLGVTVEDIPSLEAVVEQTVILAPTSPPPPILVGVAAATAAAILLVLLCVARVACRRRGSVSSREGTAPATSSPKMLSHHTHI